MNQLDVQLKVTIIFFYELYMTMKAFFETRHDQLCANQAFVFNRPGVGRAVLYLVLGLSRVV